MKRIRSRFLLGLLLAALVVAPAMSQNTGSADFSSFVAVGDSLTAGYSNGGVSVDWQTFSFGALVHSQAGGSGPYEQPLFSDPGIPAQLELISLSPLTISQKAGTAVPLNLGYGAAYNNLGIPGANVSDVLGTICGFPLFDLILRNQTCGGAFPDLPVVAQALSVQPTFLSVWIGSNDALQSATSGGAIPPTDLASFTSDYQAIIATLAVSGAKFALINIPDVTAVPFTTTVPSFVVDPSTGDLVMIGGQPVPLIAVTTTGVRALTADDLVLLSAVPEIQQGIGIPTPIGTGTPLATTFVLDAEEKAIVRQAVVDYNAVIASEAQALGAALVDVHARLNDLGQNGIILGGIDYSSEFLTGGLFGYDGVHPSRLGYAIIANEVIAAINQGYDAQIPLVDLFPYVFGPIGTGSAVLPGAWVQDAVFSREATDALFLGLGLPPMEELLGDAVDLDRPPPPSSSRRTRVRDGEADGRGAGRIRQR